MGLIECGLCDGITAHYSMQALKDTALFRSSLYDAWAGIKTKYLLSEERKAKGTYGYFYLEQTSQNLAMFKTACSFLNGYIPDSFRSTRVPSEANWLHLFINSPIPTTSALDFLGIECPQVP